MARNSGGSFAASGNAKFVAGAALGNAIGESIRANQNFNDCMLASGWLIADPTPETANRVQSFNSQFSVVAAELKECISTIRGEPRLSVLLPHMPELGTGKYSITQLANDQIPSRTESDLMAAYLDEVEPCRATFVNGISKFQPTVAAVFKQSFDSVVSPELMLVKRQLTWGEYAARQKAISEQTTARLTHIQL
jgi:hypothetical protein